MKKNKWLIALTTLSIIFYLLFSICIDLFNKTDSINNDYNLAVATGPYDMDTESIDTEEIYKGLSDVIDVPFTVSIGRTYSHGYPDIIRHKVQWPLKMTYNEIITTKRAHQATKMVGRMGSAVFCRTIS